MIPEMKRIVFIDLLHKISKYKPILTDQMESDLIEVLKMYKEQKFEETINPEHYAQWIYATIEYLQNNNLSKNIEDANVSTI